jgi:hypothetical protein
MHPSRTFELSSATTKTDTAERSISLGRESFQVSLCNRHHGVLAGFTTRGTRDETWPGQGIRKRSVSWNLPKLSQLWWCNGGFGPSTTKNHLQTKQFVNGIRNSGRVAACALRNEQAGRAIGQGCQVYVRNFCQEPSEVSTLHKPWIADASVKCLALSLQTSSCKRILAAHTWQSWPMPLAGLFISQRTGSHFAGISCTTHELFCL